MKKAKHDVGRIELIEIRKDQTLISTSHLQYKCRNFPVVVICLYSGEKKEMYFKKKFEFEKREKDFASFWQIEFIIHGRCIVRVALRGFVMKEFPVTGNALVELKERSIASKSGNA